MTGLASVPADAMALRPRSVGEMLDAAFTLYRRHFGALAVVALVCSAVPTAVELYLQAMGTTGLTLTLRFVNFLVNIVLKAIATGATVFIISESYLGRRITAGEALNGAVPLIWRIVLCTLLMGLLIGLGFVLFIVPGFIAISGLVLATPALVLEPQQTASTALSRSWELTKGAKWRMFGLLFMGVILLIIPIVAIEGVALLVIPGATTAGSAQQEAVAALVSVVAIFITPLISCLLIVAYYDLRVRKEGFDLEVLASSLQPA
jgi:uncharacterized membrane protein